ncbi:MAG: AAA family ATPase [Deltaproteobacteria bacterium]|nr:AAA family ATPase [Deltaproteobacteria bacterium]
MLFTDFVGHDDAKLALLLNIIDPNTGGVLFVGDKGSGKSTLARLAKKLLPPEAPFVELPLNITEDALVGGVDIEKTIKTGRRMFQRSILSRANGGIIYIDDINLLSPEILPLLLEAQSRGENIVEREGITLRHPSKFILVASMNQDEGILSSHLLDHFGMCVLWSGLKEPAERIRIMKMAAAGQFDLKPDPNAEAAVKGAIRQARSLLGDVLVPEEIREYISRLCTENVVAGHRADLFLFYAARAYAAFCRATEVTPEHVDVVFPLILQHRKRLLQEMEEPNNEHQSQEENQQDQHNQSQPPERRDQESSKPDEPEPDHQHDEKDADWQNRMTESDSKEEVFDSGNTFKVRRIVFRKDQVNRVASGRRTKTGSKDKGGRYVKSRMKKGKDVALDATLRAAAPYQKARGWTETLIIQDEDLRFKQREKKMGHLVIFVVDGSGSMGAQKRMVQTKSAVQSLLLDCYQKRDMISMIVFRKDRAEVILPPTSSVETASRRLREIPVGGKTPLTAGLLETYNLIKRVAIKAPETRFLVVLITDGRANQGLSAVPIAQEIARMANLLKELHLTDYIVVDTEDKSRFIRTDLARRMTDLLLADYYTIDDLKADDLTEIVRQKKIRESLIA